MKHPTKVKNIKRYNFLSHYFIVVYSISGYIRLLCCYRLQRSTKSLPLDLQQWPIVAALQWRVSVPYLYTTTSVNMPSISRHLPVLHSHQTVNKIVITTHFTNWYCIYVCSTFTFTYVLVIQNLIGIEFTSGSTLCSKYTYLY